MPCRFRPCTFLFILTIALLGWWTPTAEAQERSLPVDTTITSTHEVTIGGERVPYRATAGTQPVWNDEGHPAASLFYVFYERTDVDDMTQRPLIFSFNGGPGSASVWMHIGYTGPRFLEIDDEGFPIQPYGVRENPHSILDVADIVYVDPVNTGFSRIVDEDADRSDFFGVQADINYLADWISNFVSRHDRWTSPKYLKGESYGTTRVAGLARRLQSSHWMNMNGVILVSPTTMGIDRDGPVGDAITLPYYTATAWYHDALEADLQQRDLEDLLAEVEAFTLDTYVPALSHGGSLTTERRDALAAQVARYAGLSEQTVRNHNLAVPRSFFWKDLLRDEGLTVGRLDSRYRGQDTQDAGQRYDYDPALSSWNHAFTPAINHYLREQLGVETDLQYNIFGPVRPWDRSGDNTARALAQAMNENPFLHVMTQAGYFDGGTDYFSAKYTMWHMDPAGRLQDRLRFEAYESGHMMYLRQEDLATSNQHIREFIEASTPAPGTPARY
ncbi:MAG: carboxypeptidase [Bacteroidetes bacterium]|jgi:carboxypeptidase C (cathepsin A)|nr:carboxypeptidase [Bacteroidota bacterium]